MSPESRCTWYRRILCTGTILGLLISRPLWTGSDFPRFPFLAGWPVVDGPAGWVCFVGLMAGLGLTGWLRSVRIAGGPTLTLLLFLILGDQNRLQTWILQLVLALLVLMTLPTRAALMACRVLVLSIYVYSGLSKLDARFATEIGPVFLEALARTFGQSTDAWAASTRSNVSLLMPLGELAVGLGLISRATRTPAMVGAMLLHACLIAILGPWRLDHSLGVLLWNACLLIEVPILFWPDPVVWSKVERIPVSGWPTVAVVAFAVLFPLGERWGWSDAWPSHAVYASHLEKAEILIHEDNRPSLTSILQRHVSNPGLDGWCRLDQTGWCREVQGVPLYPHPRVSLGLAEWLSDRYGEPRPIRVILQGRSDRVTGARTSRELVGPAAFQKARARYLLNGHAASRDGQ